MAECLDQHLSGFRVAIRIALRCLLPGITGRVIDEFVMGSRERLLAVQHEQVPVHQQRRSNRSAMPAQPVHGGSVLDGHLYQGRLLCMFNHFRTGPRP